MNFYFAKDQISKNAKRIFKNRVTNLSKEFAFTTK